MEAETDWIIELTHEGAPAIERALVEICRLRRVTDPQPTAVSVEMLMRRLRVVLLAA